jgi:hypothetical protein
MRNYFFLGFCVHFLFSTSPSSSYLEIAKAHNRSSSLAFIHLHLSLRKLHLPPPSIFVFRGVAMDILIIQLTNGSDDRIPEAGGGSDGTLFDG